VLSALCLTALVAPVLGGFIGEVGLRHVGPYALLPLPILGIASYVLSRRSLTTSPREWSWPRLRTPPSQVGRLEKLAALKESTPFKRRLFRRLLWQEWRQVPKVGLMLGAACVAGLCGSRSGVRDGVVAASVLSLVQVLLGAWCFRSEQTGAHFRFLAEQGVSPRSVWASKQIVWLGLTIALSGALWLAVAISGDGGGTVRPEFLHTGSYRELNWGVLAAALLGLNYSAGQFTSLLIPRTITAAFVALVLSAALNAWMWLMVYLWVPLWFSVAPISLVLLGATLGWSRNWLLERSGWKSWLRFSGLQLGLPLVLIWAAVGAYRVYEVPAMAISSASAPITADEAATAELYRQAMSQLRRVSIAAEKESEWHGEMTAQSGWQNATPLELRTLAENQEVLQQVLAATQRPACAFTDPARREAWTAQESAACSELGNLLLLSARQLEAEERLPEALERYLAALRLAGHVAQRGDLSQWMSGSSILIRVCQWMPRWAAEPGQTPEQIEAAISSVQVGLSRFPPLAIALAAQAPQTRGQILKVWSEESDLPAGSGDGDFAALRAFEFCFPWERMRALRVVDAVLADQCRCAAELERALAATPVARLLSTEYIDQSTVRDPGHFDRSPWNWLVTTPTLYHHLPILLPLDRDFLVESRMTPEVCSRALVLKLDLLAWKKRHGQLPDRLGLLPPTILRSIPRDPYNGQDFGYYPRGFSEGLATETGTIEPGRPVLTSVGPQSRSMRRPVWVGSGLSSGFQQEPVGATPENPIPAHIGKLIFTIP
jgi:hypothetical protein